MDVWMYIWIKTNTREKQGDAGVPLAWLLTSCVSLGQAVHTLVLTAP